MTEKLTELLQSFCTEGAIPQELKDTCLVHLYERKGNRQACDNHRGISLLSIARKILAKVLLNRRIEIWSKVSCQSHSAASGKGNNNNNNNIKGNNNNNNNICIYNCMCIQVYQLFVFP